MIEMGIETSIMQQILNGSKVVEGRLRTPKFVTLRVNDQVSLREDSWAGGKITASQPNRAMIRITKTQFFENFSDMFSAIDFQLAVPDATSVAEALQAYRQFYTLDQELEYGVVALQFSVIS